MKQEIAKLGLESMFGIAITVGVSVLAISLMLGVLEDTAADQTSGGAAQNATNDGIEGLAKLPEKMPLIMGVIVAVIIIGLLVTYFKTR